MGSVESVNFCNAIYTDTGLTLTTEANPIDTLQKQFAGRSIIGTPKRTTSPSGFLAPIARSPIATTQCPLTGDIKR
jgi:hypothetical protein